MDLIVEKKQLKKLIDDDCSVDECQIDGLRGDLRARFKKLRVVKEMTRFVKCISFRSLISNKVNKPCFIQGFT